MAALAVLIVPIAAGCGGDEPAEMDAKSVEVTDEDVAALAAGGNEFALDMYGRLAGEGNLFFSPYSISTALAMTAAGARGETESEMAATLRFPEAPREHIAASFGRLQESLTATPETRGYELNVANSLWGQQDYPFKESYLKLVDASFGGGFNRADFVGNAEAERVRINEWVEVETRERIENLIPPGGVDRLTTLVLVNAVYFKGEWQTRFDEANTADATFRGEHGDVTVPMMYMKSEHRYFETDYAQVLEMPYDGDEVSMLVVLPKTDSLINLSVLESRLTSELLSEWTSQMTARDIKVYFPRFEMTWGTKDIASHLKALGMESAFGAEADFSGMSDRRDLFIGPVFHKAFVAVNEEGTEAAAATAVVMKRLAIMDEPVFRADHPFMFLIRDNATGGILFMGRVVDLG
jgi:serpin B